MLSEPYRSIGESIKMKNESIDLNNTIKNILRFIKRENPDLHARLEAKIKVKTSEAKRRLADADPSELAFGTPSLLSPNHLSSGQSSMMLTACWRFASS